MRVLLDTNVLISAIFWGGTPRQILKTALEKKIELVSSAELLVELQRVLETFETEKEQIEKIINNLLGILTLVDGTKKIDVIKKDPSDNKVLECAISARADLIVSGDTHLKELKKYEGIRIVSPAEVWKILNKNRGTKRFKKLESKKVG